MSVATASAASRYPAQVAGSFYAADGASLAGQIDADFRSVTPRQIRAKMVVVPHAGLVFSGKVAASALRALDLSGPVRRLVLIGPAHRYPLRGIALHPAPVFATPLGEVPVAWPALAEVLAREGVSVEPQAFAGEHSLEMLLVMAQRLLPAFEIVPILVGQADIALVEDVLRLVWGGPETVICLSSDLSHFLDAAAARTLDGQTRALVESGHWQALEGSHACGHVVLRAAIRIAQSLRLRTTGLHFATSDMAGGPADRVVGYGAFAFEYPGIASLPEGDRAQMSHIAAASLRFAASHQGQIPGIQVDHAVSPMLMAQRATFVTLELNGSLRGCIGSTQPTRPLIGDVSVNSVKAGFGDPRFPPLTAEELDRLTIKIAVLSPLAPMRFAGEAELLDQLQPDRDGLYLQDGQSASLFLPSVWRHIPDPRQFLTHLKVKMGKPADHWSDTLLAFRFSVESFGGAMPGGQAG